MLSDPLLGHSRLPEPKWLFAHPVVLLNLADQDLHVPLQRVHEEQAEVEVECRHGS